MRGLLLFIGLCCSFGLLAQGKGDAKTLQKITDKDTDSLRTKDEDAFFIKKIYGKALTAGKAYDWLYHLSESIGGRLSGSPQAAEAVEYTKTVLDTLGLDRVILQPCKVPRWERGAPEWAVAQGTNGQTDTLTVLALGNSAGTDGSLVSGEVIEVKNLDEVERLGRAKIEGKIVFYNRPMDAALLRTFNAYGRAVDQRVRGPEMAARFGAKAAIVRSMTLRTDDVPHTGVTIFDKPEEAIPALAVSTIDADRLSASIQKGKVTIALKTYCKSYPKVDSYNVIGEIKGSEKPEEIILIGGHLDSWDVGGGAHDDGAGCVHAMEVLHLLKRLGYQPKRTIRCVLFMNEENGLFGGNAYADISNENEEYHLAAIESDAGGFTPRGFSCDGHEEVFVSGYQQLSAWLPLLEPYNLQIVKGGSGADINPLKSQKGMLIGFRPDSQRYFDYHHAPTDRIDAVNPRELALGAAAITSLVYLIDQYGLELPR